MSNDQRTVSVGELKAHYALLRKQIAEMSDADRRVALQEQRVSAARTRATLAQVSLDEAEHSLERAVTSRAELLERMRGAK